MKLKSFNWIFGDCEEYLEGDEMSPPAESVQCAGCRKGPEGLQFRICNPERRMPLVLRHNISGPEQLWEEVGYGLDEGRRNVA